MTEKQYPRLPGEADPASWNFVTSHGPLPNPVGHTFPLLSHDHQGLWRLVGTGFYISADGLFVTAAHVVEDVLKQGRQVAPLVIMHLWSESGMFGPQSYLLRPITQCWIGDTADIVLGVAAQATNNRTGQTLSHWSWPLSWKPPVVGQVANTYAFPNHSIRQELGTQRIRFKPALYSGTIAEVGEWRDRVLVPYPFMQASFRIHGAASGGPVAAASVVVGVNCRFMEPDGPGIAAQTRNLQDAFIDDAVLLGEPTARRVTFAELVAAGVVNVSNYADSTVPKQKGRIVRFDHIRPSVSGPELEVVIAA
jgi:hypothetical protein